MSIQKKPEYSSFAISDKEVADYLKQNPDFFLKREEVLLKMHIAHGSGDAVSMLEYQADRLREQNTHLHAKLMDLVNVARENDRLNERIHRLTLSLFNASHIDDIIDNLVNLFLKDFHAQWAHVFLFNNDSLPSVNHPDSVIEKTELIDKQFENFFKANRPLCGRLKKQQLEILFGEFAEQVCSAVLIPLGNHGKIGMIAIGSDDGHRFHSSMGTIYLNQMADIITHAVKRFL